MNNRIKVLYIDDEIINLQAFKATFRKQFEVFTARSVDEGIQILKEQPIEVVLADQRMPGKTGVEFFESILHTHPNPVRILLTAFTDINAIIDAINKGQVYRYVTKPWSEYDLKLTIENAYQLYLLKEQNNKLNLKYKEIYSNSSDPIVLFDTNGRIIEYNKATLNLLEDDEHALNLTTFNALIYDKNDANKIVELFKKDKKIDGFECQIASKKGGLKTCLISGNVITDSHNNVVSYQAIIKDVTEQTKFTQLLFKKAVETQEQERERISRDLHDGVGQELTALKLQLEQLKTNIKEVDNSVISKLSINLTESINQLRTICYNILPPALIEYGYEQAVRQLANSISHIDFQIKISEIIPPLDKELETAIYRITQEFISNSVKHSNCTKIMVEMRISNSLHLFLSDNGKGFDINDSSDGLGISNIIHRVKAFNGTYKLNSKLNEETFLDIKIPLFTNNHVIYNPENKVGFIEQIITTTFCIGLHKDGFLVIKPNENFKEITELKHAQENVAAIKAVVENKKLPFISYMPEYYINNEAMDYYNSQQNYSSAIALIYSSLTQKKMAEHYIENDNRDIPINFFSNEGEALDWLKQYINE